MEKEGPGGLPVRPLAGLFMAAGVLAWLNSLLPGAHYPASLDLVGAGAVAVGLVAWFLPWPRWSPRAPLALVPPALVLIALANRYGGVPSYSYGVFFVLVFAAVGLYQPPMTSVWLAPVAFVAYLIPSLSRPDAHAEAMRSAPVTIPVSVMLGELLSRMMATVRKAQRAERASAGMLARAAVTDELTGLGNRRLGNRLLDSLRPGDALLLLDLDHFKTVNDTFGHAEGDRILALLGDFLRQSLRQGDEVARYGGEEFIVVARQIGTGAIDAAARLLHGWRKIRPLATFSVGVALHEPDVEAALTFGKADMALYRAKELGRDRVCLYQPQVEDRPGAGDGRITRSEVDSR